GGMMAILGLTDKDVEAVCKDASVHGTVCAANYNCPGQVVISGEKKALEEAAELAKSKGAKAVPLKVSGGFHSHLMTAAQARLAPELERLHVNRANMPVVANVNAEYVREPEEIRSALIAQITSPVCWTQSMENLLRDGVNEFYEIGPGKVLGGLLRRIDPDKRVKNIETVRSLDVVLSQ
ncbi:MAG: ACP S-malonyltransferase, partial [Candidatus Brocadiales bacterium]